MSSPTPARRRLTVLLGWLLAFSGVGCATPAGAAAAAPAALAADTDGVWPLSPRPEVVRGFDPPVQDWHAGHRGVDLLGSAGQRVRSSQAGQVLFAGRIAGRGIVVVGHGDTRTTYQPVSASVRVGEQVAAGETIGALVSTGSHCWPAACLHWGLLRAATYLNPLTLVGAGPVRLLPLYGEPGPTGPGQVPWADTGGSSTTRWPAAPTWPAQLLPVAASVTVVLPLLNGLT